MSRDPFQAFVDLVQYDQTNAVRKQNHIRLTDQLSLLEKQKQEIALDAQAAHARVIEAKKKVAQEESRMQDLADQEQLLKQKLESLSSHKEYTSLLAELKTVQQKQHAHEELLLQVWHEAETAGRMEANAQEKANQKRAELEALVLETESQLLHVDQELEKFEQARQDLLPGIPEEWLEKYEQLREKIEEPIVPIEGNACSYCYYLLPEPQLAALRRKALLQCKGCFRFLYSPEVHPEIKQ